MKKATITMGLDTRSQMRDGTFPIKFNIYYNGQQHRVRPSRPLSATKTDYNKIRNGEKLTSTLRQLRDDVQAEFNKAAQIVGNMNVFTLAAFKKAYTTETGSRTKQSTLLCELYAAKQRLLKAANQFNAESNYCCSYRNLNKFAQTQRIRDGNLALEHITVDFLGKYRIWNVGVEKNSVATVQSYLRCLRHIFNSAIDDGAAHPSLYPFERSKGKRSGSQKIAVGFNIAAKRFLSSTDIEQLKTSKYRHHPACLIWFWCYMTGQNPTDLLQLRLDDIYSPDGINLYCKFYRQKTRNSSKENRPVKFHIKPSMLNIIQQLRPLDCTSPYVFPFLKHGVNEQERHNATVAWRRLINRQLNRIAKNLRIGELNLSMARCGFATALYKQGVPIATISFLLGHASIRTTELYLGQLSEDEIADATDEVDIFRSESFPVSNPELIETMLSNRAA